MKRRRFDTQAMATLFRNDLRLLVRSRRTIVMSVVLPLLVWPLMLFISQLAAERQEERLETTEYSYTVVGPEAEFVRQLLEEVRAVLDAEDEGREFYFVEVEVEDPALSLEQGELHFYLQGLPPEKTAGGAVDGYPETGQGASHASDSPPGVPLINLYFQANRDTSRAGQERISAELRKVARARRDALLVARGFPVAPSAVAVLEEHDVATAAQSSGLRLGRFLTLLLMIFLLSGGAVVATDSLAGEKERGTLETLLTTALSRFEIVVAKQLAILAVALVITVVQVANLLVYVGLGLIPGPEDLALAVTPQVALLLLVLYLPVASLVSSALLLTSGYAKTYREAQLYFFPVFMIGLVPTLAPFLPGIELRSAIVLVPVANLSVAVKEVLVGTFDWPMIVLAWLLTAAAAAYAAVLSARVLSTERLITASDVVAAEVTGGPGLFPRRVLRWFAVMWALILVAGTYMGTDTDIRLQLVLNLGVLMAGVWVMLRRYRLQPTVALALRPVRPMVWLAVVLGVPSALVVGTGVSQLANLLFPVSDRLLESFGETLLPAGVPEWQLYVFLCLAPGVVEEVAFRGLLLHGLRRRLHPALLPVGVGLAFGIYHVALFRILPTAFLGLVLALVTLLSGSIFPAMLWHALNNAAGILLATERLPVDELTAWAYLSATAGLILAFWIFWHYRSPYPDLRPWRRRTP